MQDEGSANKMEAAYRMLRHDIINTRLKPGAALRLGVLRTTYGVGWTPLREALSRLEAEKLVTSVSNHGFAVAPVSWDELKDLTLARAVVDTPLLLESIERGGPDWESAVVTSHYYLSRCKTVVEDPSDEALEAWEDRHEAFHSALLNAAESSWLKRFHAAITDQLRRHHRALSLTPELRAAAADHKSGFEKSRAALHKAQSIDAHTALMEAALDRNLERAKELIIAHIRLTPHI